MNVRRVATHQPHYFPWLGLIEKIALSDVFVLLDNVQFTRRDFQNRTWYPTALGPKWLSIPVHATEGDRRLTLAEVTYAEPKPVVFRKHLETLHHRYKGAPAWPNLRERLRLLYERHSDLDLRPMDLMVESMELTLELLHVPHRFLIASHFSVSGVRDVYHMELTKLLGAGVYLSGAGSKAYMRDEVFSHGGVAVEYQHFVQPEYQQPHDGPFVPGCWALDYYLSSPDEAIAFAQDAIARGRGARLLVRRR